MYHKYMCHKFVSQIYIYITIIIIKSLSVGTIELMLWKVILRNKPLQLTKFSVLGPSSMKKFQKYGYNRPTNMPNA